MNKMRPLNNSTLFGVDIGVIQPRHGFIAELRRTPLEILEFSGGILE